MNRLDLDPKWKGGHTVAELLQPDGPRPPTEPGVYIVTHHWEEPAVYVGKTETQILKDRIGDMVSTMMDLYTEKGAPHSGGLTMQAAMNWGEISHLMVFWVAEPDCIRCLEKDVYDTFQRKYNKASPPACNEHSQRPVSHDS